MAKVSSLALARDHSSHTTWVFLTCRLEYNFVSPLSWQARGRAPLVSRRRVDRHSFQATAYRWKRKVGLPPGEKGSSFMGGLGGSAGRTIQLFDLGHLVLGQFGKLVLPRTLGEPAAVSVGGSRTDFGASALAYQSCSRFPRGRRRNSSETRSRSEGLRQWSCDSPKDRRPQPLANKLWSIALVPIRRSKALFVLVAIDAELRRPLIASTTQQLPRISPPDWMSVCDLATRRPSGLVSETFLCCRPSETGLQRGRKGKPDSVQDGDP